MLPMISFRIIEKFIFVFHIYFFYFENIIKSKHQNKGNLYRSNNADLDLIFIFYTFKHQE